MSTRKRLAISISCLAVILVVAVATVAIVFAALQGDVKSSFTIKYSALNVEATVSATYQVDSDEAKNFTDSGEEGGKTQIEFTANEAGTAGKQTGELKVNSPIVLSQTKRTVVVTYTFQNDSNENAIQISCSQTTLTQEGLTITYDYGTDGLSAPTYQKSNLSNLSNIEPEQTLTVKIKFEIPENSNKSVEFKPDLTWSLTGAEKAG